jgi:predicted nucleic acid-binding protein
VILADSSVWIDHLHRNNARMIGLLRDGMILCHPFVFGEIALGILSARDAILSMLSELRRCAVATDAEVLELIERYSLFGRGIGYVDVHLLASVKITPGSALWTLDKRLHRVAGELGFAIKAD